MQEEIKKIVPIEFNHHPWRTRVIMAGFVFLFLLVGSIGGSWAYTILYKNKIFPGVYLGNHHIGGLTKDQAKEFVENFNNRIAKEGIDFKYTDTNNTVRDFKLPSVSAEDSSVEMVKLDSNRSVEQLFAIGRSGNVITNLFQPVLLRFFDDTVVPAPVIVEDRFISSLENYMRVFGEPARNANFNITSLSPLQYTIVQEKTGSVFDYEDARKKLTGQLAYMALLPVMILEKDFRPDVLVADLGQLASSMQEIFNYGNLNLTYTDPQTSVRKDWAISPLMYSNWMEIRRENGEPIFALNKEKVLAYLETLRPFINTPAKDAKFIMENERVKEFQANQSGLILNEEKTYADLDTVFKERNYHPAELVKTVTVSIDIVEPNVVMSNVNNLGIMEVVGVGYSTFKDSHTNRIKNIANAVKRLNGILIKPDEEFSANKYAGPYIAENGFLPEMVIKGNRIIPEIGGGMCQIGTTLFRAAMNSGMPITERRNHSLVVSYYADPVNGNPGTDATLYEPNVDFKFKNDTGGYLLLQTSIDYVKQELVFTFWGKSDGRKGSYTHPVVNKWIPAGEPQEVVVTDLKPGERKCQNAFRGAMTSFTYTIIKPNGEKVDKVFDSYYRPLSQICMVGAPVSTSTVSSAEIGEPGQ